MCFSASASFTVGAALLPAGGYCCWQAWRKDRPLLPVAVIPIVFGLQQFAEGIVWLRVDHGQPSGVTGPAVAYLFFALAFWPFWPSFCANFLALDRMRRLLAALLTIVNLHWLFFLFGPIYLDPDRYLEVRVVHHSLHYEYSSLPIYTYIPRPSLRMLYFVAVVAPLFLGSGDNKAMWLFGAIVIASIIIAYVFFAHAFISVWCFFAAIISGYLCYFFRVHQAPFTYGQIVR